MGRRFGIEPALQRPRQQRAQRRIQFIGRDVAERGFGGQHRREPVACGLRQRRIGQIRPFLAFAGAQEHDPVAPLLQRFGPRQPVDAETGDAVGEFLRGTIIGGDRHRLVGQRNCAEPAAASPAQACARGVESDLLARGDAVGKALLDLGKRDRRGGAGCGPAPPFRQARRRRGTARARAARRRRWWRRGR